MNHGRRGLSLRQRQGAPAAPLARGRVGARAAAHPPLSWRSPRPRARAAGPSAGLRCPTRRIRRSSRPAGARGVAIRGKAYGEHAKQARAQGVSVRPAPVAPVRGALQTRDARRGGAHCVDVVRGALAQAREQLRTVELAQVGFVARAHLGRRRGARGLRLGRRGERDVDRARRGVTRRHGPRGSRALLACGDERLVRAVRGACERMG